MGLYETLIILVFEFIVKLPMQLYNTIITVILPLQTQDIPLVLKLKENWVTNIYPTRVLILYNQCVCLVISGITYNIIYNESDFLLNRAWDKG